MFPVFPNCADSRDLRWVFASLRSSVLWCKTCLEFKKEKMNSCFVRLLWQGACAHPPADGGDPSPQLPAHALHAVRITVAIYNCSCICNCIHSLRCTRTTCFTYNCSCIRNCVHSLRCIRPWLATYRCTAYCT